MSLVAGPAQPAGLKMTVVTVCRNAAATVEKTIQSVLWQDYPDLEYVVIDGMSTDGTWEILQRHRERLSRLLHEPDTGIYNAMNKGIGVSTGDVLVFLNADDYFVSPYVLSRVAAAFAAGPELDIVYGDYLSDSQAAMRAVRQPDHVDRKYFLLINPSIMHQSMFCRRRAYERVGLFDEERYQGRGGQRLEHPGLPGCWSDILPLAHGGERVDAGRILDGRGTTAGSRKRDHRPTVLPPQ